MLFLFSCVSNKINDNSDILNDTSVNNYAVIDPSKETLNNSQIISFPFIKIPLDDEHYYKYYYKNTIPSDVPEEIYNSLYKINLEVINNLQYDSEAQYEMYLKEHYYKYGKGNCTDYVGFFYLLAYENGLTENLYCVSGDRDGDVGHIWLEYRTKNNIYIIDPTWNDIKEINKLDEVTSQRIFKSDAYGKHCFFITYKESKIMSPQRQHSSYFNNFVEIKFANGLTYNDYLKASFIFNKAIKKYKEEQDEIDDIFEKVELAIAFSKLQEEFKELYQRIAISPRE